MQIQRQQIADQQSSIADQQISPLQVLFGFMGENLPIPENDVHSKPVICNKCKDVFLRTVYCWLRVQEMNNFECFHDSPIFGENIVLQRHSINSDSDIVEQQLNSLGVLFDFIEKNYYDFDSVDL